MYPLTILVVQKLSDLLTSGDVLEQVIATAAQSCNIDMPVIASEQVVMTSVTPDMGDMDMQLTYPRVCLYSAGLRNSQVEKFRSLSGSLNVVAEVWASATFIDDANQWLQFYVDAITSILRQNLGDWGNGAMFAGAYDVQFQAPKAGGYGFVQSSKITFSLAVSQN